MRETIVRCSLCHRIDCDGKEYITEDMYGSYGIHVGVIKVCRNKEGVILEKGEPVSYRLVSGHGDSSVYKLFAASETVHVKSIEPNKNQPCQGYTGETGKE